MAPYNDMSSYSEIMREIDEWTIPSVNKQQVDPQSLIKMTAGYAVEQHQWDNYGYWAGMTPNNDVRKLFAQIKLNEEEHLSLMGSLSDPEMTTMEASLALEMTAISGFAEAAQLEPNPTCKSVYEYILFDHLTQTQALAQTASTVGTNPEGVTKGQMQIREGRPFEKQFVPTDDLMKPHLNKEKDDIMSFVNLHMLKAAETGLHNEFQMFRKMLPSSEVRRLYNVVTAVETLHTIMLSSLDDPKMTPLERAMVTEMVEIRTHQLGIDMATQDNVRRAHEYALRQDEQHLSWLRDAYSNIEKGDSAKFAPSMDQLTMMPQMTVNDYINQIAQTQMSTMPRGMGFERAA